MLGLGDCVRLRQVVVNLFLIGQIIGECAMHLLQRQRRVAFHHALGRDPLTERYTSESSEMRVPATR